MAKNGRQKRRERLQREAATESAPAPTPAPEPRVITRLYGDGSGDDPVDFDAADPQLQSLFVAKLPAEIRAIIYEKVWTEAGLSQHILPQRTFIHPNPVGVIRYRHAKCITLHDNPVPDGQRGPPPDNLDFKVARRRKGTDPSFKDGTDPMWQEDCYFCKYFFDSQMDTKNLPHHPIERDSPFLPMLLCCKIIYTEVFKSIANTVCFQFMGDYYAKDFLGRIRLPIVHELKHILVASEFTFSDARKYDWPRFLELLQGLPNLRHLTFWMDRNRRWRNNEPRHTLKQPRLCGLFAQVPAHINLKVTVPVNTLKEGSNPGNGVFRLMIKYAGGLVEGATLEMAVGDLVKETLPLE